MRQILVSIPNEISKTNFFFKNYVGLQSIHIHIRKIHEIHLRVTTEKKRRL